jgi:hypothetical protein
MGNAPAKSARFVSPPAAENSGEKKVWTPRCYRCGESKAFTEFHKDRTKSSGRASICKECDRQKGREYYGRPEVRERKLEAMRRRYRERKS